jgi:hypothetical protein
MNVPVRLLIIQYISQLRVLHLNVAVDVRIAFFCMEYLLRNGYFSTKMHDVIKNYTQLKVQNADKIVMRFFYD